MFVFRKSDHAVAHITGRQHAQFFWQRSGAAASVGNRDDHGQIRADFFQSAQEGGKAGSTANGHNLRRAVFVRRQGLSTLLSTCLYFSEGVTNSLKSAS